MTSDGTLRSIFFVLVGVLLGVVVVGEFSGSKEPIREPSLSRPTVTKTVTEMRVETKTVAPDTRQCQRAVELDDQYQQLLSTQAKVAGQLNMAADDMLFALNNRNLKIITDTNTKYHQAYSTYVDTLRDVLSTSDALRVALADCSSQIGAHGR